MCVCATMLGEPGVSEECGSSRDPLQWTVFPASWCGLNWDPARWARNSSAAVARSPVIPRSQTRSTTDPASTGSCFPDNRNNQGRTKTKLDLPLQQWRRVEYAKGRARLCRPPNPQFPLSYPFSFPSLAPFSSPLKPFPCLLSTFPSPPLPSSWRGAYWRLLANTTDRSLQRRQIGTQLPCVFKF